MCVCVCTHTLVGVLEQGWKESLTFLQELDESAISQLSGPLLWRWPDAGRRAAPSPLLDPGCHVSGIFGLACFCNEKSMLLLRADDF